MIPQKFFAEDRFYTEFYDYLEYLYDLGYDDPLEGVMDEPDDRIYEVWEATKEKFTIFTPDKISEIIGEWLENQEERMSEDGDEIEDIIDLFSKYITEETLKPINDNMPELWYDNGHRVRIAKKEAIDYLNHK